ncbi:MAG: transporter substrate-binding domain-containing protein, partial [Deltaproteobacteria bacterium]|nr:transporter substrate-binding domain-containing protein [Deltaproteobacteria bacterium]
ADKIGNAIAAPLFHYDMKTVASIISSMVADSETIRAIELIDNTSESILFAAYTTEDNQLHSGKNIPAEQKNALHKLSHPVTHEQEEIGLLQLHYKSGGVNSLNLTSEERAWINSHPKVKLGVDPSWPPLDFIESGKHQGISADILKLLTDKVGIQFELVQNQSWQEVLDGTRNRTVDVISLAAVTDQRSEYLLFSKPVEHIPWIIAARSDKEQIAESVGGLSGKKVGIVKGKNISIIGKTEFEDQQLSIAVRSDWPVLQSIINKGLADIPYDEILKIRSKWIPVETTGIKSKSKLSKQTLWLAAGIITLLLFLVIMGAVLARLSKSEQFKIQLGTQSLRWVTILSLGLFIAIVILTSWLTLDRNRLRILDEVESALKSTLQTTWERMHLRISEKQIFFKLLERDSELINGVADLISMNEASNQPADNFDLSAVPSAFERFREDIAEFNYLVVDRNGINIATSDRAHLGLKNALGALRPDLLKRAFQGEIIFVPPMLLNHSALPSRDGADTILPVMFFAGPLKNTDGEIIAVILQQIDPTRHFSKLLQTSRMGKTGEIYAFNVEGRLLSESRFDDNLRKIGLIAPNEQSILTIEIRDPGGNMVEGFQPKTIRSQQPLTLMARKAIAMKGRDVSGENIQVNIEGYNDYRGVPVVGAWLWDEKFGFGMTSEMDMNEALLTYTTMR